MRFSNESVFTEIFRKDIKGKWIAVACVDGALEVKVN